MAHPKISDIRAAIIARLSGLDADLNRYAYLHPQPTMPALCVGMADRDFLHAMDGQVGDTYYLWVLVSDGNLVDAQERCDRYLDAAGSGETKSIEAAIYADATLGGVVSDTTVHGIVRIPGEDMSGPTLIDWYGTRVWGFPLRIDVIS